MVDNTFVNQLASSAPTPGGGGASAYCGMLAAALSSMVGELTVGKPRFADVQDEMRRTLEDLAARRVRLEQLVDEDAEAFAPLAASYRMPHGTAEEKAEKHACQQKALAGACAVPLEIMEQCGAVIDDCVTMAEKGTPLALSDAGASAVMAKAALQAAALNVFVNANSMDDEQAAEALRRRARQLIGVYGAKADGIYTFVGEEVGQ